MSMFEGLKRTVIAAIAAITAGTAVYLTRENSTIRTEPERVLPMTGDKGSTRVLIRKAIVWGNPDSIIDPDTLVRMWQSTPRLMTSILGVDTSTALMLAKASSESAFHPQIARYEHGQHTQNPNWAHFTEFQATSGGLFQIMGFNLVPRYRKDTTWSVFMNDVPLQLGVFDTFMYHCVLRAQRPPVNGKDIVYRAIADYGGYYANINRLADINYKTFLLYLNKPKNGKDHKISSKR